MKDKFAVYVPDMSCGHCVKRITGILESMGVEGFIVSLDEKRIYSDFRLEDEVLKALADAGYPVSPEQ